MSGQLIQLSAGKTHYKIEGEGRPILLVHGATVGLWEFDPIIPYLHQHGFQTIRFDLYGHGISDRPRRAYDLPLYHYQLKEFIQTLELEHVDIFLGHSMGAAVLSSVLSDAFIRQRRSSKLILLAPLLEHESKIAIRPLLRIPILGRLVMESLGRMLMSRRRTKRLKIANQNRLLPQYLQQIQKSGHWRALRGIICEGALADHAEIYQRLGKIDIHKSLIWGDADAVISRTDTEEIKTYIGNHDYYELSGLEHNLLLTHPQKLAALVFDNTQSD